MARDFTIVFAKLKEEQLRESSFEFILSSSIFEEADEIAELRRMVAGTMEPEPASFTAT
jgi:hypothetical protein